MNSVLVGMFDSQTAATQARTELLGAGFADDSISITGGPGLSASTGATSASDSSDHPGAISRFFSSIFGEDKESSTEATRSGYTDTYNEAFKRGSYGVSVNTESESEMDMAETILNDCGASDIDEQAEAWRKDGWVGATPSATATRSDSATDTAGKLQEVEEELKVGKRAVAKGGVRIFSRTMEVPVSEVVRLREEHADVRRTAVDRPATEADLGAFKEGSFEVRETAEEPVVSKSARVTGEVQIGKTATEREETIRDTVRKTKVEVEQISGTTPYKK